MEARVARDGLIDALNRSRAEELDELHRAHRPARYRSIVSAWATSWLAPQPDLRREPIPSALPGELCVSFAGHSTVLLGFTRLQVAVNPMLGARIGIARRAQAPGLRPADLAGCDLVLITHGAKESLHRPTLRQLPKAATVVVPSGCAGLVSGLGFARVVELGVGSALAHRGVDVTATAVRHRDALGYILRGDGPSLFYCGASGYFPGFAEIGVRYRPDIALLPISGYLPRSFRHEHMSPLDALYAFEDLAARMLIPIRHGTFVLSYERIDEPLRWLKRLVVERDLDRYVSPMTPGSSRKFVSPRD
jgi:L-ascorbate metabolism protein UlaG (beta-lactamase superfamily)